MNEDMKCQARISGIGRIATSEEKKFERSFILNVTFFFTPIKYFNIFPL